MTLYFFLLFFFRAVWAVANGDYVEAHAAQAVVVQYPFKSLSLSYLFLSFVCAFQEHYVQTLNSVSHTDVSFFLCGFECKKKVIDSSKFQFHLTVCKIACNIFCSFCMKY